MNMDAIKLGNSNQAIDKIFFAIVVILSAYALHQIVYDEMLYLILVDGVPDDRQHSLSVNHSCMVENIQKLVTPLQKLFYVFLIRPFPTRRLPAHFGEGVTWWHLKRCNRN